MLALAEAVSSDTGANALPSVMEPAAREEFDAAVARLGAAAALEARALGHAIAPGRRVLHAAQLMS
jgi:hypothetical protein